MIGVVAEILPLLEVLEVAASSAVALPAARHTRERKPCYERGDGGPAMAPHRAAAAALADNAVERNAFASPGMLHAAATHLAAGEDVRTLVAGGDGSIAGLLQVKFSSPFIRPRLATVWAHEQTFDTTPVVAAGAETHFFDELFAWLQRNRAAVLRWPRLALDGPMAEKLERYLERTGRASRLIASHRRPMLDAGMESERQTVAQAVPHKRRKDIERHRRRLSGLGALSFRAIDGPEDAEQWANEFLRIEASGWKGEAGTRTALACRPAERTFFLRIFKDAALGGQLLAHCLELDGVPIAMTVNFRCGDTVWAYKTAYDDRYARYGPGALLEVEGTQAMLADPTIRRVDSCSDGDNGLIREIWGGKRLIGDIVIGVRPGNAPAVTAAAALARLRIEGRARLKKLIRGRRAR